MNATTFARFSNMPMRRGKPFMLIQQLVTQQTARRPDAPAVVNGGETLTYEQLEVQSNRLARVLHASGCSRRDRVCLLSPKTPAAIVAILAIYKADCIYVPVDPTGPSARLARILAACEPRCLLMSSSTTALVDDLVRTETRELPTLIGSLDDHAVEGEGFRTSFCLSDLPTAPSTPMAYRNWPDDPAHILFTSGSTGAPKGVVLTHANVTSFVKWANRYFGVTPADRLSAHSPLPFDLSVYDVFGPLAAGASLYPVPPELNVFPKKLAAFIRETALTQWFSVPSVLGYMAQFDAVEFDDFPALKRLLWCGEVLPTRVLRHWMSRLSHVAFTNLYGPTETTIASSYHTVPECPRDDGVQVPIGRACAGEELLVLDDELQRVPAGELGQICIRGEGLSPGYWGDAAATAAAFVPNPHGPDATDRLYRTGDIGRVGDDGLVYFAGRRDSQIKSRGHRIELGEIEAALRTLPCLVDSVVVAIPSDGFEGTCIGCAYTPEPGADVTPASVRKGLAGILPAYMLPSRWKAFPELPLTANGKADRRAILQAFAAPPALVS